MPVPIKAVIFDIDGTLLDSLDDLADSANAALAAANCPTHPADAYRLFVGDGMETLMRRAAPAGADEKKIRALYEAVRQNYAANWRNKTCPYDGIVPLLEYLLAKRLPLAVLSNKPHDFSQLAIRHFFPDIPFVSVRGKTETGKGKPDPSGALAIAAEIGVNPGRLLFVGDSGVDMDTSANAGAIPAGALWGFRSREELVEHGARLLLDRPQDIMEYC
ncbi:MAG: HAD family hydrolase [Desulfovibrio sp.]|jgi:phosphoglycolate phosphatase|nr:HAD family hydrolase [Desulfovibrio sp.]